MLCDIEKRNLHMKKNRPTTLIIASVLLVLVMFAGLGLPALFPSLAFSGNTRRFQNGAGGSVVPGQGFNGARPQGNDGNLPPGGVEGQAPGNGRTFGGGRQFGGGGANPLGGLGNTNSTAGIVLIGLQVAMNILKVVFAGLGLIAALGLFRMKRWGLVLSILLLVFSLVGIFLPTTTLMQLAMPMLGIGRSGAIGNAAGGNPAFLANPLMRLNWFSLLEPVGLAAVVVLGLMPASRKAMAPITDEDLLEEDEDSLEEQPAETAAADAASTDLNNSTKAPANSA